MQTQFVLKKKRVNYSCVESTRLSCSTRKLWINDKAETTKKYFEPESFEWSPWPLWEQACVLLMDWFVSPWEEWDTRELRNNWFFVRSAYFSNLTGRPQSQQRHRQRVCSLRFTRANSFVGHDARDWWINLKAQRVETECKYTYIVHFYFWLLFNQGIKLYWIVIHIRRLRWASIRKVA